MRRYALGAHTKSDLKVHLVWIPKYRERSRSHVYHLPSDAEREPADAASGAGSISSHLQAELANLTRTFEELSSDRLRQVGGERAGAPRVWVLGFGAEDGVARYARLILARIRPGVHLIAGQAGSWAEDMAMMGLKDSLLVTAFRPVSNLLSPILEWARTSRVTIIAITDPTTSDRLRRLGANTLICHVGGQRLGHSQTAAISPARLLATATAQSLGGRASRRLELIGNIHGELEGKDYWYDHVMDFDRHWQCRWHAARFDGVDARPLVRRQAYGNLWLSCAWAVFDGTWSWQHDRRTAFGRRR